MYQRIGLPSNKCKQWHLLSFLYSSEFVMVDLTEDDDDDNDTIIIDESKSSKRNDSNQRVLK